MTDKMTDIYKGYLLAIIIFLVMCSPGVKADGLYLTIGAGVNDSFFGSSTDWDDDDSTGSFLALSYRWDRWEWCKCNLSLNYAHISQWESGPPFGDDSDEESTIDHIGVSMTWMVWGR